jgi:carboxypeptidase Taq
VILRYELEQDLLSGALPVADLPAAWDDAMTRYLGISTGNDFADGCMQDVHWYAGLFGYFPTYTLGALAAAQWFATAKNADPDIMTGISEGRMEPLLSWLRTNVHGKGRLLPMQPLLREVTGSELNADFFKRHLETRYLR